MQPKPEHRITAIEKRVTHLEGSIEELSADTAEELRAVRKDISANFSELKQNDKRIFDHVQNGFQQARDFVQERFADVNSRLDQMQGDITELKSLQSEQGKKLDQILTLLQQKQD